MTTSKDWSWIQTNLILDTFSSIDAENHYYGIDPGTTNLGVAHLHNGAVTLYEVKIVRNLNPVVRVLRLHELLSDLQMLHGYNNNNFATIEGAAFGSSRFRQVELAEIRASAVIWLSSFVRVIDIIQPNSIRKLVLGAGNILAHNVWKDIPPNSAAALSCALYSQKVNAPI